MLDFDRAKAAYNFGSNFSAFRGPGRATWVVSEETAGAYGEYSWATEVGELRCASTSAPATSRPRPRPWVGSPPPISNTETNSYSNFLPALQRRARSPRRPGAARGLLPHHDPSGPQLPGAGQVLLGRQLLGGRRQLQLEPLVSDNADLGLEWYFTDKAVLGVAVFYKDIDSFISSPQTSEPLRPEDVAAVAAVYPTQPQLLDPSLIWTYRTSANTEGTKLKGFEIGYSADLHRPARLPAELRLQRQLLLGRRRHHGDPRRQRGRGAAAGALRDVLERHPLLRAAALGVRLSVNNRDDYLTNNLGANGNVSEATTGPVRWDMSAVYNVNGHFSIGLEGINLTNEAERLFTTGDGTMDLVREINYSGRQMFLGVRFNL